jgi:hypothetical protein
MRNIVFVLAGISILFFSACNRNKKEEPTISDRSKADDAAARNEFNRVYDIAEDIFNSDEYDNSTSRVAYVLPCGNVTLNAQNFTIDYSNSTTCGSRVLSGTVAVELQAGHTKFSEQGAVLKFTFTNYKVLYTSTNQSLTYNGTAYVTNTSGGKLLDLFTLTTGTTVEHKIRANLNVLFDSTGNGSANVTRTWHVFRKKVFESTGAGTGISLTLTGDTSSKDSSYINGTYNKISEYGLNREGKKFINDVTQDFVWENCGTTVSGPYKLKRGSVTHTAYLGNFIPVIYPDAYATFTATAGAFGSAGTPSGVIVNNCTSNGYNISWTIRNGVNGSPKTIASAFLPY